MSSWVEFLSGNGQGQVSARPLGEELERAAAGVAAMRVVSGGAGSLSGGRHASRLQTAKQVAKVLGPVFLRQDESILHGVGRDGKKRDFGACSVNGKQVKFDWWCPHLGIAIDTSDQLQEEIDAKLRWVKAEDRRILYFPPTTPIELIAANAATRRKAREEA